MTLASRELQLQEWLARLASGSPENFHMISGDASFRRYFRFQRQGKSLIAVDAPPASEKNREFVALSRAYRAAGMKVPSVVHIDLSQGFLVLDDFGDQLFALQVQQYDPAPWYQAALAILPRIQDVQCTRSGDSTSQLGKFDGDVIASEYTLFNDWLLQRYLNLELTSAQWRVIQDCQTFLTQVFLSQPQVGVHRDYHSRILMILAASEGQRDIGIIDFQDALIGPITYDAVSLLRDCYVVWPDEFVAQQLQTLHRNNYSQYPWQEFVFWFDCVGMQRHVKASGIFSRLSLRDGKHNYLRDIPRTLRYLSAIGASMPQCQPFAELVEQVILPAMSAKLVQHN